MYVCMYPYHSHTHSHNKTKYTKMKNVCDMDMKESYGFYTYIPQHILQISGKYKREHCTKQKQSEQQK